MGELKLWKGECDLVIAESAEDAAIVVIEKCGPSAPVEPGDFSEYTHPTLCLQEGVAFDANADGRAAGPYRIVSHESAPSPRPVAEVIAEHGRGYLCGFEP